MTFEANIARLVTGDATSRNVPNIALQALEEGLSSPSLYILAGLSENEQGYVVDQYFQNALRELDLKEPDLRTAALRFGAAIAKDILEGKIDAFNGVQDIKSKCIDIYPFFEESGKYCYDSIGFDGIYGLFLSLEDMRNPLVQYDNAEKTRIQFERELSQDLLDELKKWTQFINDTFKQI